MEAYIPQNPQRRYCKMPTISKKTSTLSDFSHKNSFKKSNDAITYVHNILTQYRQEEVHDYFNPRHVRHVARDSTKAKHVFETWKSDEIATI